MIGHRIVLFLCHLTLEIGTGETATSRSVYQIRNRLPPQIWTQLKAFNKLVQDAMRNDTHTRQGTRFLPPSPSLPDAVFDSAQWRK